MYDSLSDYQKKKIGYGQLETIVSQLLHTLLKKIGLVLMALCVSIPFIFKFHISNGFHLWILELLLWIVWIKESTNWTDFNTLMKKIKEDI